MCYFELFLLPAYIVYEVAPALLFSAKSLRRHSHRSISSSRTSWMFARLNKAAPIATVKLYSCSRILATHEEGELRGVNSPMKSSTKTTNFSEFQRYSFGVPQRRNPLMHGTERWNFSYTLDHVTVSNIL